MKLNKPKFWDTKISFISIFFFPLSLLVLSFIFLKKKFTTAIKFNVPIICVGNIYVGGTGKTPISILLANELLELGKNPVILRKYYKNHFDEHGLIKKNFKNLILSQNRINGIKEAEKKDYDSVILDDGLQDYKIKKDLNIVCFNNNQLIGNGLVLPAGPLRENLNSLKNASIIIINGIKNIKFEKKCLSINKNLKFFYSHYKPINFDKYVNKKLIAIAGIGNPENFFEILKKNHLKVEKEIVFPDHYKFKKIEIQYLVNEAYKKDCQIIMTEKDYFKIKHFNIDKINYLKVSLEIEGKTRLINTITKLYDKKN